MDKTQALYVFWASFGIPAIDEISAYDEKVMEDLGIDFPYISFEAAVGEIDSPVALSADLWYRSTSWAGAEAKADQIVRDIGYGGKTVPYTGGMIWITRGTPAYQRMDAADHSIRRMHININAEFLSA